MGSSPDLCNGFLKNSTRRRWKIGLSLLGPYGMLIIALFMKTVKYLLKPLEQTLWLFVLSSIEHGSPSSINAQGFALTMSWLAGS
jgi:hypothetical protein